jgi:hypothetical protein
MIKSAWWIKANIVKLPELLKTLLWPAAVGLSAIEALALLAALPEEIFTHHRRHVPRLRSELRLP